jgi:hypothetical protein
MSIKDLQNLIEEHDIEQERDEQWEDERVGRDNPDYVATIYFDPTRFDEPDALDRLRWLVRSRRPANENRFWHFRALNPETLKQWSPLTSAKLERRFLACGYVTDLDELPGKPGHLSQAQDAKAAFSQATVIAEAVIRAVQKILGDDCPKWLAKAPTTILGPMTGRHTFRWTGSKGQPRQQDRDVPLIEHLGLWFGCGDFFEPRTVIASKYWVVDPILAAGRCALLERQHHPDEVFQTLIQQEIETLPRHDLAGVALWACQQVALMRFSASEASRWTSPSRFAAIEKGSVELSLGVAHDRGYRSWRKVVREIRPRNGEHRVLLTGIRLPATNPYPLATRSERVRVSAIETCWKDIQDAIVTDMASLYDSDGRWCRPAVQPLRATLREELEIVFLGGWVRPAEEREDLPRDVLLAVARWLGELRRWGRAFLTPEMAALIRCIMQGGENEDEEYVFRSEGGREAIDFIGNLMTSAFWTDVERVVHDLPLGGKPVPVIYDWTPVGPVWQPERMDGLPAPIVTQGPYLAFPAAEAAAWTEKAASIGPEGLIVA